MADDITRNAASTPSALPPGTRLGEFELRKVLGVGGFGIVYLAFDHALEREVAVKEYMPASLVGRTETMHVTLRSQNDAETFALGLRSFVNEARMLARFDHPSLLKVHRFWEANGTAYMAMPVLLGKTLKELRMQGALRPDEAWLRRLLDPLLGAIERLHNEGVYHRDIAPDNIQIEPDGHPVLMDFGAARRVISDKSQHLTAILKPAYAPIEQYAEIPSVKQGPWTDLYALGATVHYLLMGKPPTPSTARAVHDDMPPLAHQTVAGCSVEFLRCIDWMLAPRPADRPQNVAQLREALAGRLNPPHQLAPAPLSLDDWQTTVVAKAPPAAEPPDLLVDDDLLRQPPVRPAPSAAIAGAGAMSANRAPPSRPKERSAPPVPPPPRDPDTRAPRSSLLPVIGGLAVVAVVAVGAAVWLWPQRGAPVDAVSVSPPVSPSPSMASAPSVAPAPEAALPAAPAAQPPTPAPLAEAAASAAEPAPVPSGSVAAAPAPAPASALTPAAVPAMAAATKPPVATKPPPTAGAPVPAPRPTRAAQATPATGRGNDAAPQQSIEPYRPPPPMASPPMSNSNIVQVPPNPSSMQPEAERNVATGPEAVCGARNPVMYFVCMERECLRSRWSNHADCQKWRAARPQN